MTEFPSAEADELVTRQFLRAELAELRGEFRGEMAELRTDVRGEIAGLRTEMRSEFGTVRGEIADLRNDLTLRMVALFATAVAVLGTLNALG